MGQIVARSELAALGERLRAAGQRVVFTNGHFDLLHVGHLRLLQAARARGDALVVGVNDDATTRARKGATRPIVPEAERAELLAGLACVDYVTIFGEATAEATVDALRPHVYVKGGDYAASPADEARGLAALPEAPLVRSYGGDVAIVPLVPGRSTTLLEQAMREEEKN